MPIDQFQNIDISHYSYNQLLKYQYLQKILNDLLVSYQAADYRQCLKFIKQARSAISGTPHKEEFGAILVSIENIIKAKQGDIVQKRQKKLGWDLNDVSMQDKSRYLFGLWLYPNFDTLKVGDHNKIFRAGAGLAVEAFLPYWGRKLGLYGSFDGSFLDFNNASMAQDYIWYRYTALLQFRFSWHLPFIEEKTWALVRFGVNGQIVQNLATVLPVSPASNTPIMPYLSLSMQDPLLNHIFQNNFNKNLIFHPEIAFEYLPGVQDSIAFTVSFGLYYRIAPILIGPRTLYRIHYDMQKKSAINDFCLSFVMCTQL